MTKVVFSKENPNLILSSGEDNLLNLIDLGGDPKDDFMDGSYVSDQPLESCGFIEKTNLAYAITTINTLELIDIETMTLKKNISSFPHDVNYIIDC